MSLITHELINNSGIKATQIECIEVAKEKNYLEEISSAGIPMLADMYYVLKSIEELQEKFGYRFNASTLRMMLNEEYNDFINYIDLAGRELYGKYIVCRESGVIKSFKKVINVTSEIVDRPDKRAYGNKRTFLDLVSIYSSTVYKDGHIDLQLKNNILDYIPTYFSVYYKGGNKFVKNYPSTPKEFNDLMRYLSDTSTKHYEIIDEETFIEYYKEFDKLHPDIPVYGTVNGKDYTCCLKDVYVKELDSICDNSNPALKIKEFRNYTVSERFKKCADGDKDNLYYT